MSNTTNTSAPVESTETTTKFVRQSGKGALFAKADRDSGEIAKITGEYTTVEGVVVYLKATLIEEGALMLTGTVQGHPRVVVEGLLIPEDYNADYKSGYLNIGKVKVKLNSKSMEDRHGEPYRFLWMHTNTRRVGC